MLKLKINEKCACCRANATTVKRIEYRRKAKIVENVQAKEKYARSRKRSEKDQSRKNAYVLRGSALMSKIKKAFVDDFDWKVGTLEKDKHGHFTGRIEIRGDGIRCKKVQKKFGGQIKIEKYQSFGTSGGVQPVLYIRFAPRPKIIGKEWPRASYHVSL